MKRSKYPSFTTHSVQIFYIAGCRTRNAFFKIFTLRVVQPAIHFKKNLYFYIAGYTTRNTFKKNFVTRNVFINCFVLRVVQPAICYGVVVITWVVDEGHFGLFIMSKMGILKNYGSAGSRHGGAGRITPNPPFYLGAQIDLGLDHLA